MNNQTESTPTHYDVIVVGAGPGGMAAALAARESGAEVLVIEALDEIGGNAIWSTGYLAFTDFAPQQEAGIEDSVERFLADARAEVDRQRDRYAIVWDETLTRRYIEESGETYRILTGLGVEFGRFIPRPDQHTVNRMVSTPDTFAFQRAFASAFESAGVALRLGTRVRRLETNAGRVVGVVTETSERITAQSVILATGGYQAGAEVRRRYQPEYLANTPYLGVATCRGDGHVMGQSVGGDLINMTMIQPLVIVASALVEDCIAVNLDGNRFHDECGPYDDRVDALGRQPNRKGFYIFDGVTAEAKRHLVDQMPQPSVHASTLNDLADQIGLPGASLLRSVGEWNAFLAGGTDSDPVFGRVVLPADRTTISTGPFHATPMVVGVNFPAGGFRVTTSMAVVDVHGDVVPGLYAVGDCVGGVNPCLGLGGIHITSAFTLGRVAGKSAAMGDTGAVHALASLADPLPPRASNRMAIVNVESTPDDTSPTTTR